MGKGRVKSINKTLKFTGILCGIFTGVQAVIWLILTLTGFICFFVDTGTGDAATAFRDVYMDLSAEEPLGVSVKPTGFMILIVFYFLLSGLWLYTSLNLMGVYKRWNNVGDIKKASRLWMATTLIICVIDLIIFIIFMAEFMQIGIGPKRKTRAMDFDLTAAKKFSYDFSHLISSHYLNETVSKINEFYNEKYNAEKEGNEGNEGEAKPEADAAGAAGAPGAAGAGGTADKKPADKKPADKKPADKKPALRKKRSYTDFLFYPFQIGYNTTAWAYSLLPTLPIPSYIREQFGNPFQPLLDAVFYFLFGPIKSYVTTTLAPIIIHEVKPINPKLPPAVVMVVASRGILIWIANICLLAFMFSLLKKLRVEMNGIFGCFFDICRPKPKPKRKKRSAY